MISIEELKSKEDILKLNKGDKILLKYVTGKMYLIEITKIDHKQIIGKYDTNFSQEVFIDIESLINRDLGKYVDCVVKLR
ncbi:hypothetical protein EXM90_12195 [Clostridium botulinum]|uniref:hypothetical protein n=1 Tax=Clostridium botulinum TaxID=1491 RepID=UPI0007747F32|nr:hypothetical protein [Clostridium botulinum]MBN3352131.1 hypothetical protein [Clostridium botulinum]MBN3367094.1 hypothetical protein [Clostridium botulinum]MBN3371730.1 hypothetical protein [Clostridium botulinum]MBN3375464.1 hypothetical protein [Clostridium botulinum]MBN3384373.1 hypothetical protein [Clostridium botulinum]